MKFCILTLGCKVNQYEAQAIERILIERGHTPAQAGQGCDVCVVNTCAVTAESARKSRQAVRRMKKLEPGALIAVCGCLSQLEPSAIEQIGADLVGGSGGRREFALEIERLCNGRALRQEQSPCPTTRRCASNTNAKPKQSWVCVGEDERRSERAFALDAKARLSAVREDDFEDLPPGCVSGRTRALLKIQDGCDCFCAYCVIPYARGRARSLPPEDAAFHAAQLETLGFREIVLTGIEISSYGKDLNSELIDVLQKISAAAPNARLRLGSLDPGAVTEPFCRELRAIPKLCPHFHLSLQSGCDETLRRMGRNYSARGAFGAVQSLRRLFPDCGVTADLIAGFPGETEDEFRQTLDFIKSAAFSGMHIFPFSPRPGTRAAGMPDQIKKSVRIERARAASEAAAEMAQAFRAGQIGKTVEVLFESESCGFRLGRSGNYLEVAVKNGGAKNTISRVKLTGAGEDGIVYGEIAN